MDAGRMDRCIVIDSLTIGKDADGAPTETWTTYAHAFAQADGLRGDEYFAARRENAAVTMRFTIRWMAGVKESMRISYEGEYYNIENIREIGRRDGLEMYATRKI